MKHRALPILMLVTLLVTLRSSTAAEPTTLHILAFDLPQAQTEQRLADTNFTPKTGIKVVLETNSPGEMQRKLGQIASAKDTHYDLVQYDNPWLGRLVSAGLLERLDTTEYLGTNSPALAVTNSVPEPEAVLAITNAALSHSVLRPEIVYRVTRYPTRERDLFERKFELYQETPVFGLPWRVSTQILAYRSDLVDGAFARVQPSVAEIYNTNIAPNWTNEWHAFVSAAKLVQLINTGARGVCARASPETILKDFLPILWGSGGELWNEERRKTEGVLNSATNIKALQFYCDWNLREPKIAPPESVSWNETEALNALGQNKAATSLLSPWLAPQLEDTKRSKAAGRVSYGLPPGTLAISVVAKPGKDPNAAVTGALDAFQAETTLRRATLNESEGVGISAFSTQKRAAWQYLQWLLSRQTQLTLIFEHGSTFLSARKDLAAESSGAGPVNKAVADAFESGIVRSAWNLPEASQLDAVLARECNLAFRGQKKPKEALDTAAKETQAILDKPAGK